MPKFPPKPRNHVLKYFYITYIIHPSQMKPIPRRKFLQDTAMAGGALFFLPNLEAGRLLTTEPTGNYFLREFGIDETLCRKLLAKALSKGGDFADLYFEFNVSNYLGLEDGKVNQSYGDIGLGVGIRTVKDDQIGYGFTQELTEASMMSAATTASTLCNMGRNPYSRNI